MKPLSELWPIFGGRCTLVFAVTIAVVSTSVVRAHKISQAEKHVFPIPWPELTAILTG